MSAFRRMFVVAVVCLAGSSVAQLSDQLVATRVLGPHWKQMARASGMIFSGTVLSVEPQPAGKGRPLPLVLTKFRVNRGIVGVRDEEVISIHEWAGAWSSHRAMRNGQRMLIFYYPTSRLGLTSPVAGPLGQIMLDPRGEIAATNPQDPLRDGAGSTPAAEAEVFVGSSARVNSSPSQRRVQARIASGAMSPCGTQRIALRSREVDVGRPVSILTQLERAIRSARKSPVAIKE